MLFIFDMGGVVTNTAGKVLDQEVAERIGISVKEFYDFCKKGTEQDMLKALEIGRIDTALFWKEFSANSGKNVCTDWFRILFHPVLIRETVEVIDHLKTVGDVRLVCGTNTIESHYDNHISRGDYALFDMTYASHHMGVAKPDPLFFSMILDAEGVSPEDAFFVDDKIENCNAASSLGIRTCVFKNGGELMVQAKAFIENRR